MPQLRILQVSLWLSPWGGGVQSYLRALLAALHDVPGLRIAAAALHPGSAPAGFAEGHVGTEGRRLANLWRLAWHLAFRVREFDVVHVHGVVHWPFLFAALACRVRGVPCVASPHGQLASRFLDARPRRRLFARCVTAPLLRRVHAVVATTSWEAAQIEAFVPRATIVTVPPGVLRPDGFAPAVPHADSELRIVFVGELSHLKGVPLLLHALAQLHAAGRRARLVLVGAPADLSVVDLRAMARELGIEDHVELAGYLAGSAKWEALARAHVLALPSHTESFGFAAAEALCAGVPVVVTREVGLAGTVERHGCGSVVAPGDATALAQALARYAEPAFRAAQAAGARRCAEQEFALAAMRTALLSLYESAAARPRS